MTRSDELFPLRPTLPLPAGVEEDALFAWLQSVRVENAPPEIVDYCTADFRRFVYTYGLVRGAMSTPGKCLELGANPYFATVLLKQFTPHEWYLANYFGRSVPNGEHSQEVEFAASPLAARVNGDRVKKQQLAMTYQHFNIEEDAFPYADGTFDVVLLCEIIEHLLMDPARVLREIRRVMKPGAHLILTTPNVSRLENAAKMLAGANIYDPYSRYGPYGRHNREYNKHELWLLLKYLGFEIQAMFTADVHQNDAAQYIDIESLRGLLAFREADLGQYIFLSARAVGRDQGKKPSWLYRSYAADELE